MSYDVYGVGAALVDTEYAVDDAWLLRHGVAKGHMTLVDETRLMVLLAALEGPPARRNCGGSAANTAIATCGFGGAAHYSCRVAGDEAGAYFLREIAAAGVDARPHDETLPGATGRCLVLVTPDAERSMNTFLGASDDIDASDIEPDALRRSRFLYMEGYLASSVSRRGAAVRAREIAEEAGVSTSLTLSDPTMVESFRENMEVMLGEGVGLLFCNEEEALVWCGTDRVDVAANELRDIAPLLFITLGEAGSLAVTPAGRRQVPGYEVPALDTTGAGDMYAGACLFALTHGSSPFEAARFANYAAAQLVAVVGARLPSLASYQAVHLAFVGQPA